MIRRTILVVLLCGTIWGLSEATLGGWLYAKGDGAVVGWMKPVILSAIGLAVLAAGRACEPRPGSSAAIGALAMLFKFLNAPFFACHLLGIFLLGLAFDVAWTAARGRHRPLIGAAAAYLGFGAFAFIITWVIRYHWWYDAGWPKVARYVGLSGTITAAAAAVLVPLGFRLGRRIITADRLSLTARRWALGSLAAACAALWVLAGISLAISL